jgi:hypothetical protein
MELRWKQMWDTERPFFWRDAARVADTKEGFQMERDIHYLARGERIWVDFRRGERVG